MRPRASAGLRLVEQLGPALFAARSRFWARAGEVHGDARVS
jgi:hypothetical protein